MLQTLPPQRCLSSKAQLTVWPEPRHARRELKQSGVQQLDHPPVGKIQDPLTQELPPSLGTPGSPPSSTSMWAPGLACQGRRDGAGARSHVTSKVGQPPNPRNWHLPFPSPLTELEGEERDLKESTNKDRTNLQGFMLPPHTPSPPPKAAALPGSTPHQGAATPRPLESVPGGELSLCRTTHRPTPGALLDAPPACGACSRGEPWPAGPSLCPRL